jgi:hypothetical protein
MDGGCLALALAIKKCFADAEIFVVASKEDPEIIQHFVGKVYINGLICFMDADGAAAGTELLRKMEEIEMLNAPFLVSWDDHKSAYGTLTHDAYEIAAGDVVSHLHAVISESILRPGLLYEKIETLEGSRRKMQ